MGRKVEEIDYNLKILTDDTDIEYILCYSSIRNCDTRCSKFRISEWDTMNAKLMPKNPPMFCYCGKDVIGELKK
jgi:hypothetical protein